MCLSICNQLLFFTYILILKLSLIVSLRPVVQNLSDMSLHTDINRILSLSIRYCKQGGKLHNIILMCCISSPVTKISLNFVFEQTKDLQSQCLKPTEVILTLDCEPSAMLFCYQMVNISPTFTDEFRPFAFQFLRENRARTDFGKSY